MKISTVSKKVICSALSAAMVVAFAPTVAFGATEGQKVAVEYDLAGGVAPIGTQTMATSTVLTVNNSGNLALTEAAGYTNADGYVFSGWWYDADADGKIGNGETVTDTLSAAKIQASSTIKLVAQYAYPTVKAEADDSVVAPTAPGTTLVASFENGTAWLANHSYEIALAGPDGALDSYTVGASDNIQSIEVGFGAAKVPAALSGNKLTFIEKANAYKTGKYTITVTDKTASKEISTAEFEITEITFSSEGNTKAPGTFQVGAAAPYTYTNTQTVKALVGQKYETLLQTDKSYTDELDGVDVVPGVDMGDSALQSGPGYDAVDQSSPDDAAKNKAFVGYTLGGKSVATYGTINGTSTTGFTVQKINDKDAKVAANDVLVAVYNYARIANGLAYANGVLTFDVAGCDTTAAGSDGYYVQFSGPAGDKTVAVTDDSASYNIGETDAILGSYTAKLVEIKDKGKTSEKVTVVGEQTASVVKVAFDKGEATDALTPATGETDTEYTVLSGSKVPAPTANPNRGKVFNSWQIDGEDVKVDKDGKITVPEGAKVTVVATYADEATTQAKAPSYTYADGKVTFANEAGDAFKVQFNSTIPATPDPITSAFADYAGGTIAVATTGDYAYQTILRAYAVGKNTATLNDSNKTVVFGYDIASEVANTTFTTATPYDVIDAWAAAALAEKTSLFKSTAPQYYRTVLTTAQKAAQDAIKAVGYASTQDWDKAIVAQERAIVEAIAGVEKGNLEAALTPAKSADGKTYSYVDAATYAKAIDAIDQVLADFDILNDNDTSNDDTVKTKALKTSHGAADYSAAIRAAATVDLATADASDVEAAAAVAEALKAAATSEDAEKALADYEALTDAQKKLVPAADVLAAHEVIDEAEKAAAEEAAKKAAEEAEKAAAEAAAALVAQQDKAAVNLVNNPKTKTVKLATAKKAKTTLTYKVKVSASGSLVTYAKVSGNAKITVGAAGKVTLKKVTKAGTYKAKVLVTCGAQTRTVTVKFVVAK